MEEELNDSQADGTKYFDSIPDNGETFEESEWEDDQVEEDTCPHGYPWYLSCPYFCND